MACPQGGRTMAGLHTKRNRRSRSAKVRRRRRVVGLSASAGGFLAAAMCPLATAPQAKADVLDVILEPIIEPLQQALTGLPDALSGIDPTFGADLTLLLDPLMGLDATAGLDPTAGMAGLDHLAGLLDPSSLDLGGSGFTALPDASSAATSTADPSNTWVQGLEQDWINSPFGQQVDGALNTWAAQ